MKKAVSAFFRNNKNQNRKINSVSFEHLRKLASEAQKESPPPRKNYRHSDSTKDKISKANTGLLKGEAHFNFGKELNLET